MTKSKDYLKPMGLSETFLPNTKKVSSEEILRMYGVLTAALIELHLLNAQLEHPKDSLEVWLGQVLAGIQGVQFDPKKMRRDRAKLQKEFGKPDSVKLREFKEKFKQFAIQELGMIPPDAFE